MPVPGDSRNQYTMSVSVGSIASTHRCGLAGKPTGVMAVQAIPSVLRHSPSAGPALLTAAYHTPSGVTWMSV